MARRRRRGTLGGRPGEFFPFGTGGGALGAEGQQILYDLPLTSVATLDDVLTDVLIPAVGLSSIQFAWGPGDANAPRIWLGAENTADRLTLTGTVDPATATPWQDANGDAIVCDGIAAGSVRGGSLGIGPDITDDLIVLQVSRPSAVQVNAFIASYYTGGRGWIARRDGGAVQSLLYGSGATVVVTGGSPTAAKAWQCSCLVVDRTAAIANEISGGVVGPDASLATLGSLGTSLPVTIGYLGTANGSSHRLLVILQGAGLAAAFKAGTFALPKRLTRLLTGIEPRSGSGLGATTFTRASAASMTDRNGRLHLISSGMPRAGEALAASRSGIRLAPTRTNKCYNNVNPAATTGWTATGGTHAVVSDAAALAADLCEALGPNVYRFAPGAGDEVIYGGAATATTDPHSLSVYLRGDAGGESVDIGLRDASSGAVQNCGTVALTTHWVRYLIHGAVPADTDQVYALDCDAGDTIYHAGDQLELGARCTSMIPNWATAAAAVRAAEVLTTPVTLSDSQGAVSCGVTPMSWSDTEAGDCLIVDRATGTAEILRVDSAGGLCSDDGTTEARDTGTALADGVRVEAGAAWVPLLSVVVDGTRTSVAYDGALQGSGALTLEPDVAEVAVDSLRVYRRYR